MCLSSVPVVLHTGTFVLTLNCVSIPNPCFVDFRYVNCVQYADTPDTLACFTVHAIVQDIGVYCKYGGGGGGGARKLIIGG